MCADPEVQNCPKVDIAAEYAYDLADAMLIERNSK